MAIIYIIESNKNKENTLNEVCPNLAGSIYFRAEMS